jgi:flagellar hook assembly protein FlgD
VWDTYNNPSSKETIFEALSGAGLRLDNVYNFPNPFRSSTAFTFQHNQVTSVDAQIKIFTVAGRLIQTLQVSNIATQFVQIPWDGRDRDGDAIANGIYLYKIIASTHDHRLSTEAVGKLSVAR